VIAQTPVPTPGAARPEPADERRTVAWLGKSVLFRGDLISLEDMSVDGRVEGTIELRSHTLTIGPEAQIKADIVAKRVVVRGAVTGTITASEKVEILETAVLEGEISSPRVSIADGASIQGQVKTTARDTAAPADTPRLASVK
jgi:cytoskeletal protein CcmA (bactofilin family)